MEIGDSELDLDNVLDAEYMVSVCAGLVTIDNESDIIRLVHYTTQEYFERIRESWNPRAQQEIASSCLTYLSFKTFASGASRSDEEFEVRLAENVFYDYAATHWVHHVRTVQKDVFQLALPFLQNDALVASTSQIMSVKGVSYRKPGQYFVKQMTGLHITAAYGLLFLLEELLCVVDLKGLIQADSRDSNGRSPLSYAAESGQEAVVKLLAERDDVEMNSRDKYGRSPLSWAAREGREVTVELLLGNSCVDNDSRDRYGQTPLLMAASNGHENVLKLLLAESTISPESKDAFGRTPFSQATARGHIHIAMRILKAYSQRGITAPGGDMIVTSLPVPTRDGPTRWICDVCAYSIPDTSFRYHCGICNRGDFDLCQDCAESGAKCLDDSHILIKRTVRD